MKVQTALIIGFAAIMTPLILKDLSGSEAPKRGHLIFGVEDNRAKIDRACIERLRGIPKTRNVPTEDELLAIWALGSHRSDGLPATDSLLRVVHIRTKKPEVSPVRSAMTFLPMRPDLLTEYPAARALIKIGLPSVRAIMAVLGTSEGPLSKEQLKIYSGIILEILGSEHARPFVVIESKTMPGKKKNCDALLGVIDKTRTEWLSRERDVLKALMKAPKPGPAQESKPVKLPSTRPARR